MHWLLKAEPDSRIVKGQDVKYTIQDLKAEKVGTWDGVRNNEARKHMVSMRKGDKAFFYRSNCKEPGIVGTMTIVKEAYPDATAKDPKAPYYAPKNPDRWVVVDVEYESEFARPVLLHEIKAKPELKDMALVRRSRLSVTPVTDEEWKIVMEMAEAPSVEDKDDKDEKNDNDREEPEPSAPPKRKTREVKDENKPKRRRAR